MVGARGALAAAAFLALTSCSYLPAGQERARAIEILQAQEAVKQVSVGCEGAILASDGLCADLVLGEGTKMRFERVGSTAVNIVVAEAGNLEPRVASCRGIGPPNFHRESALGHHFQPTLIDLKEAVSRHRELLEEVEFWPQCPSFWEVQDKRGENICYCARRKGAAEEPPRPVSCP
jgi:hypothetical protein